MKLKVFLAFFVDFFIQIAYNVFNLMFKWTLKMGDGQEMYAPFLHALGFLDVILLSFQV